MAKGDNRLKILYVLDELKSNSKTKNGSEDNRFLSANSLINILNDKYNLKADRKSVYNYIESLIKYGYDIEKSRRGYFLREHYHGYEEDDAFELAELKMIVDALSASRFISVKKTLSIINKLKRLIEEGGDSLQNRQVYQEQAIKSDNSSVIYSIDAIHTAILTDKTISFKYQKMTVNFDLPVGKLKPETKKDEENQDKLYVQSPYALVWKNEYYYVICYDSQTKAAKTFRVDRMKDVTVSETEAREGNKYFEEISITEYANTAFSMYGGETVGIVLRVKQELAGVIADRFGKDIGIYHDDDNDFFRCTVNVQKSPQFYSWLSGFGSDIQLVFPKEIRADYMTYIDRLLEAYRLTETEESPD